MARQMMNNLLLLLIGCSAVTAIRDEARAVTCVQACYKEMHWELYCVVENNCAGLPPVQRDNCNYDCVQRSAQCQMTCWDNYDAITSSCDEQCEEEDDAGDGCRSRCFLERFKTIKENNYSSLFMGI